MLTGAIVVEVPKRRHLGHLMERLSMLAWLSSLSKLRSAARQGV